MLRGVLRKHEPKSADDSKVYNQPFPRAIWQRALPKGLEGAQILIEGGALDQGDAAAKVAHDIARFDGAEEAGRVRQRKPGGEDAYKVVTRAVREVCESGASQGEDGAVDDLEVVRRAVGQPGRGLAMGGEDRLECGGQVGEGLAGMEANVTGVGFLAGGRVQVGAVEIGEKVAEGRGARVGGNQYPEDGEGVQQAANAAHATSRVERDGGGWSGGRGGEGRGGGRSVWRGKDWGRQ